MSRLYVSTLNLTLKFLYSVKNKPKKGNNEYMFQLEKKDPNYNFFKNYNCMSKKSKRTNYNTLRLNEKYVEVIE